MTHLRKNSDIDFVARHYRPNAFRAPRLAFITPWWRRRGIAVAASIAALAVSATVWTVLDLRHSDAPAVETVAPAPSAPVDAATAVVVRIEFTDAPLSRVVADIEQKYGVTVSGLTDSDSDLRLTLSYEGTAADLVDTINDLLGTELTVHPTQP